MNDNVQKPITVLRMDFIDNLASLVNSSMLPPYIIEPILKDVYMEVKSMSTRQYEADKKSYEEMIKHNCLGDDVDE